MPGTEKQRRLCIRDLSEDLPLASDAIEAAEDALLSVPFRSLPLEIIYAADLAAVARDKGAKGFQGDRIGGMVTGLLCPGAGIDGSPAVIFNAKCMSPAIVAAGVIDLNHLFRHEGWHAVMTEQSEHGDPILRRLWDAPAGRLAVHMATEALEEYRTELACCGKSGHVIPHKARGLDGLLAELEDQFARASATEEAQRDAAWHQQVPELLHDLFNSLGHLAAEQKAGLSEVFVSETPAWQRFIGTHWNAFCEVLDQVPSAEHRVPAEELDKVVLNLADVLKERVEQNLGVVAQVLPSVEEEGMSTMLFDFDYDVAAYPPLEASGASG